MEKPILFNTEMVLAILDGRKTQTRRLIRPQPEGQLSYIMGGSNHGKWDYMCASEAKGWGVEESRICKHDDGRLWTPPFHADDVLYVRETWKQATGGTAGPGLFDTFLFKADEPQDTTGLMVEGCWHPSIHMPKAAARIWLKVKRVRVERLKDITEEDAEKEGCQAQAQVIAENARQRFMFVWNSTMTLEDRKIYGFNKNPWVWVIDFERLEGKHDD